jgi:CheY-like chemotaxis protein
VAAPQDKYSLDFTSFFSVNTVRAEKIAAPAKLELDPKYRIGAAKLESEGYFVAAARRGGDPAAAHGAGKVIVVEDDPITNAVLLKVLATDGFEVRGALDGDGMVRLFKEHGIPDLIVLDLGLPGVSGLQILSRIRKHPRTRPVPVVIITGRSSLTDVASGFALGANGYLSKPATVESLRAVMREIFAAPAR